MKTEIQTLKIAQVPHTQVRQVHRELSPRRTLGRRPVRDTGTGYEIVVRVPRAAAPQAYGRGPGCEDPTHYSRIGMTTYLQTAEWGPWTMQLLLGSLREICTLASSIAAIASIR